MPIQLENIQSGYNLSLINQNFQTIENTWDEKLDRIASSQGNQMDQDLDLNNNNLLNAKINGVRIDELEEAVTEARVAAETAATNSANSATESMTARDQSVTARNQSETFANAAEASADRITGITTLPVLEWQQGAIATNPTQRYLFNNILYIAPSASATNPITLGTTPVGNNDWTDWSAPNFVYSFEQVLPSATNMIQLPQNFFEISDAFVNGISQPASSYVVDTNNFTITFNEVIPAGTFVKVWAGRPKNEVLQDYAEISQKARSIGTVTKYTATATGNIVRPSVAFNNAEISINGVVQIPGASYSYIIETDSNNASFNQIRFSESLPANSVITGLLRNV